MWNSRPACSKTRFDPVIIGGPTLGGSAPVVSAASLEDRLSAQPGIEEPVPDGGSAAGLFQVAHLPEAQEMRPEAIARRGQGRADLGGGQAALARHLFEDAPFDGLERLMVDGEEVRHHVVVRDDI